MNLVSLLLRESWVNVAVTVLTGLISGLCNAKLIILINTAINQHSTSNLGWYFVGVVGLVLITGTISQFLLISNAQRVIYKLRLKFSKKILSAPLQQLEELGANRLLAVLIGDVQTISESVFLIPLICVNISIIFGCLIYLISLSGVVFFITLVFAGLAITFVQILLKKAIEYFTLAREEDDNLYKHFRSITEGIKELKLHNLRREKFFSEELEVTASKSRHLKTQALRVFVIAFEGGQLFFFSILGVVVFVLPTIFPIPSSVVSAYVLTITYLILPIQTIMDKLPTLLSANVALQKVEQMGLKLANQAEINSTKQINQYQSWEKLELNKITHTYRGEKDSIFILGELDLVFYPGQLVFIIGGNGSGKSTFAKLITGLYIPETGGIQLDNIQITDENREWYRQHFSVIFSDFYLFDNLLGIDNSDIDAEAEAYLYQLQLEHKVQVNNGKLSTTSLSQGQRKRLALLSAYLEDRPIYIFDEWASEQDPFFRDIFYEQLLPGFIARGKTVIVISHDDRYFHLADRVIKLDYGKVEFDRQLQQN